MQGLTITAPAKVNLFLGIGAVRPDGYHDVDSILQTLEFHDTVSLTPSDELTLTCDADLGIPGRDNLAFRAACEFSKAFEVDVLVDIAIEKRIPAGAGLAGGSSDAAAVLAGLAYWAGLPFDDPRLQSAARSLGADVPFFLYGGTALMSGRGDELVERLPRVEFEVVLVRPNTPVPTAEAYRAFDADPQPQGDWRVVAAALEAGGTASGLAQVITNNMTRASTSVVPAIGDALAWVRAQGGVHSAQVAGSGSAVFGVCESADAAARVSADAIGRGYWSTATRTRATGVTVETEGKSL